MRHSPLPDVLTEARSRSRSPLEKRNRIDEAARVNRTAREMFTDAQAAGAPAARIEAYGKLLRDYPDSDVSPQAAFMIGFIQSEELKDYDAAEKSFQELLAKYPRSELAASAKWMTAHMRNESAPEFMNLDADSTAADSTRAAPPVDRSKPGKAVRSRTGKP